MTHDDERFTAGAIHRLAAAGRPAGDAPFGSLLVGPDGSVLAQDHNTVLTDGDICAHPGAETGPMGGSRELDAATAAATTMYTSCQLCGMCTVAIERLPSVASCSRCPTSSLTTSNCSVYFPARAPGRPRIALDEAARGVEDYC